MVMVSFGDHEAAQHTLIKEKMGGGKVVWTGSGKYGKQA